MDIVKTLDNGFYVARESLPSGAHSDKYVLVKIGSRVRKVSIPLNTISHCELFYDWLDVIEY